MKVFLVTDLKTNKKEWVLTESFDKALGKKEDILEKEVRLITEDVSDFLDRQSKYDEIYLGIQKGKK